MKRTVIFTRGARSQRGMALAGTMMLLLAILSMSVVGILSDSGGSDNGLMTNSTNSLFMANARRKSVGAFNMAEAGVQYTMQWLNTLPAPPANNAAFGPTYPLTSTTESVGTCATVEDVDSTDSFAVTVYPDVSNPQNEQKKYLIESSGTSNGVTQVVQVYIEESSLSKWLILVNQWPSGNYWVSGLTTFDGPVHDNNADGSGNPGKGLAENVVWNPNATSPMWSYTGSDAYQLSGSANFFDNNYTTAGAPQNAAQWGTILAGGESTYTSGAPPVTFPSNSNTQLDAALDAPAGSSPTIPSATGVTVTPGGGIYIHCKNSQSDSSSTAPSPNNDVQQMTMSVDSSGNQVMTILQNDDNGNPMTTTVTLNVASDLTQIAVSQEPAAGGSPTITTSDVAGLTNGVVYSDGNIGIQGNNPDPNPGDPSFGSAKTGGISGTIANNDYDASGTLQHSNSLTVVTASTKNTNIDGNLVYATARAKDSTGAYEPESEDTNFTKNAGTLGIVSNDVWITQDDANDKPITNIEVDGAVLAYDEYEVDEFWTRPPGNWENMGGYLSNNMGFFGVFNGSNQLINGMNTSFNYDARMRDTPPPYFPTTSNQYEILSWRRVSSTLE